MSKMHNNQTDNQATPDEAIRPLTVIVAVHSDDLVSLVCHEEYFSPFFHLFFLFLLLQIRKLLFTWFHVKSCLKRPVQ